MIKKLRHNYDFTVYSCFGGYIVQAIVNNFAPLLFLHFEKFYGIPLAQITFLVTFNFGLQLVVDLLSSEFVDRIGYRICAVMANVFVIAGLLLMTILPDILPSAFAGLLISVMIYALGGGLMEVIISPIMEACPTDNKETAMSMLHSFYCWGQVGVVLITTLFFAVFGISHWKIMALVWMIPAAADLVLFTSVPIASLIAEGETGMSLKELVSEKIFWLLMVMMVCSGACELGVSQWASSFAEAGLGVSKSVGDIAGPMLFGVLMGISRTIFAKFGERMQLRSFMIFSAVLCFACYLVISFSPSAVLSLIACAVCGFSVGIFWPGTFSVGTKAMRRGGTRMFALFALAGDLGCTSGPTLVGRIAAAAGDNLKTGFTAAALFPLIMFAALIVLKRMENRNV